ncbi:MAG TPA: chemotaxis protein CheB [Fimbriimonas sp.]|nr:chemotaxis protein CheB [Fimbriimonas sp.]
MRLVVIGASAGGVEALLALLPALPKEFPAPVAIVVHVPPDRHSLLTEIFDWKCEVGVKEAEDKEMMQAGCVYFAPPDYHLLVERNGHLSLSLDEPVMYSRPSIDVLFESAADAFGPAVLGIILTGANSDGAKGLQAICAAGGMAWVQDPKTAHSSAMPTAAISACPEARTLDLAGILENLARQVA